MSKRKKAAKAPMVLVRWVDASMSSDEHWQSGIQPEPPKRAEHVCLTLGFLAHADEHFVQVVQTIATDAHAHVCNIPRLMIESIETMAASGPLREQHAHEN